jgi:hypothetical protein
VSNGRVTASAALLAALLLQPATASALEPQVRTPVRNGESGNRVSTSVASPGLTQISLESPAPSAILSSFFTATGWAIDEAAPSGTGVDAIQVYAYPNFGSGQAPLFLGAPYYGLARADVAGTYGDQFADSGFSLDVASLPAGSYRIFVFAHNVATNGYTAYTYTDVVVAPLSAIVIDTPAESTTSPSAFEVSGWALDNAATSGTGVDAIHVYVTPAGAGPIFLGAASLGWTRPDIAETFGTQFAHSGYHFTVSGMVPGDYVLSVYGHTTATNTFTLAASRHVHVSATTLIAIDMPAAERTLGTRTFTVSGWALDLGSIDDSGIDTLHVHAYPDPGSGRAPVFLGAATVGYARSDVAAIFGSQYGRSGYALTIDADAVGLAPGVYDVVVWAHRRATGSFTAVASVRVRLP